MSARTELDLISAELLWSERQAHAGTRLVADVVTGKLDVRGAAAQLPEESAPETAEDDTDLSVDPEPADEEAIV